MQRSSGGVFMDTCGHDDKPDRHAVVTGAGGLFLTELEHLMSDCQAPG